MPIEKSVGAIIFIKKEGKNFYLLLKYPSVGHRGGKNYWDLAKGHIEKGENEIETLKREVEEETGLKDIEIRADFKGTIKYFFKWKGKNILKFVTFYLAETKTKEIKISGEHIGYKWLSYSEAMEQLTFQNAKEILKKAYLFLTKNASFS